jgi:putative serine protease PepD
VTDENNRIPAPGQSAHVVPEPIPAVIPEQAQQPQPIPTGIPEQAQPVPAQQPAPQPQPASYQPAPQPQPATYQPAPQPQVASYQPQPQQPQVASYQTQQPQPQQQAAAQQPQSQPQPAQPSTQAYVNPPGGFPGAPLRSNTYTPAPAMQAAASTGAAKSLAPQKGRASKGLSFLMGALGVLVGAALAVGIIYAATDGFHFSNVTNTLNAQNGGTLTITPPNEDATLPEAVAAKVLPSVVNIDVYADASSYGGLLGDGSSGGSGDLQEYGLGSGVVLTEDGYILTNYHVVEGGAQFLVRFDQDTQLEAKVVGTDPSSDLAVIKVDAKGLIPIEVADSSEVAVGAWVMAVGRA